MMVVIRERILVLMALIYSCAKAYPTAAYGFTCTKSMAAGSAIMGYPIATSSSRQVKVSMGFNLTF
jgi:hypothetical protein